MLTELTLSNFKSYHHARLPLAPLTFLIGANASGKSNML
jgi:AAA15 family ATPase/GTPase